MKILVICKANRFRSKVAESILSQLGGKDLEVKSAGVQLDTLHPYMVPFVIKTLQEKGYPALDTGARVVDDKLVNWADRIIVVANNVDPSIFPKKKTIFWPIVDADENEHEQIIVSIDDLEKRIQSFLKTLKV